MKAKFVNEGFREDSDPITDMGIGLVGTMISIPQGWERNVMNKMYKRYKTTEPYNDFTDWEITKAESDENFIKVTLEQKHSNWKNTDSGLLLTPQQIKLFAKKYQNLKK